MIRVSACPVADMQCLEADDEGGPLYRSSVLCPTLKPMFLRMPHLTRRALVDLIGLSRHSALSVARTLSTSRPPSVAVQAGALALGSGLIGVAVALLVEARLGLPPYDVLASGVSEGIGISLGQAGWALAAMLFAVATAFGRPPSVWGITFVFLNGLAIDAASGILQQPGSLIIRLLFVSAGIFVMALGINVVIHSGTTGGPFELLMAAGEDRGVSRLKVRYTLDIGVLVLGILFGGAYGPATLFYGAFMGLTILVVHQALQDYRDGRTIRRSESNIVSASDVHTAEVWATDDKPELVRGSF